MSSWDFLKFCIAPDISGTVNFFTLSGKIMLFYNFTRVNKYSYVTKQNFWMSCRHGLIYTRFYKYARDNLKNIKKFLHKNASKNGQYYMKIQEKQKRP